MAFLIHEKLEAFDAAIEAVRRERKALIEKTVSECRHPVDDIRELPYRESDYAMHAERPWLICLACGFTEEGWGCGYHKLRHGEYKASQITKEEWLREKTLMKFQADLWPAGEG